MTKKMAGDWQVTCAVNASEKPWRKHLQARIAQCAENGVLKTILACFEIPNVAPSRAQRGPSRGEPGHGEPPDQTCNEKGRDLKVAAHRIKGKCRLASTGD